jgi:thioester reductase-like protein
MPPSGVLLKEVMRQQKLRALYLPPSIAEQLLMEPDGIDFFTELDFLCYTGGPFSPSAGEKLSKVTELVSLYGSTEAFQVPQLVPSLEDWAWMEWNPHFKVDMQASSDEAGTFELVLFTDETTKGMSALNHNLPGVKEYRTKDLFKRHPQKHRLWQYYGRRDDIIVLSNGEKFNPVPMELQLQSHTEVSGALIVGQGRSLAVLLIEPNPEISDKARAELQRTIWPTVEEANRLLPAQGRVLRHNIIIAKGAKPFTRAGKGTIVRKLTEQLYLSEIDILYKQGVAKPSVKTSHLKPPMVPHFTNDTILTFVRGILIDSFPEFAGIADDDDLFSYGLDSVMIGQLLNNLKAGLKDSAPTRDFEWVDIRTVYRHSSVNQLTAVMSRFLNSETFSENVFAQSRVAVMEDLIRKYTQDLKPSPNTKKSVDGPIAVALVGSTGYLGPRVLGSLLKDSNVATIYCLNRSPDAEKRTKTAMEESGLHALVGFNRVKFIVVQIGAPELGLSEHDFRPLSQEVDTIIYNAWKPDFALPLSSFEEPFLSGLRHVIDWSRHSHHLTRIVFISSIAAVGNWSKVCQERTIPEVPIMDLNVAMHMGYGESKCVAERILQFTHKECGIPVSIIRTGQIGGCSSLLGGQMPVEGWLLALARTSKELGVLPTHVSPVDWVPVDVLGKQILDIISNERANRGYGVFNLVHPDVQPWSLFLDTLTNRFGLEAERTNLPKWLDMMEERARTDTQGQGKYVALKFADFLRSMGEGMEGMRSVCGNISRVSDAESEPLSEELLAGWLQGWRL